MNTKKAVQILKEHGYIVNKADKGWQVQYPCSIYPSFYSNRQLINHARTYTSEGQQTPINKNVKYYRHRNNRHHTKQSLANESYEEFFRGKLRKDEDRWNWD